MTRRTAARTAHVIDEVAGDLTYCGQVLWTRAEPGDSAAVRLAYVEGYALFADVGAPADALECAECRCAYERDGAGWAYTPTTIQTTTEKN